MPTVTINGTPITVRDGTPLLKAVEKGGITLPTLCHHKALAPYGACRLCMVMITAPRRSLVASCTYPVEEDLGVETHSPEAVQARGMALEAHEPLPRLGCDPQTGRRGGRNRIPIRHTTG